MGVVSDIGDKNIVNVLLEGAGLSSFTFHTSFQLLFCCDSRKKFDDKNIPNEITLSILGDWWFGNKKEWNMLVNKLTGGFHFIEPDEPVLAFKLAALRWSDGSIIDSVKLSSEKLQLRFECGDSITIMNSDESSDCAWEIFERSCKNYSNCWSVWCEDGKVYHNVPI